MFSFPVAAAGRLRYASALTAATAATIATCGLLLSPVATPAAKAQSISVVQPLTHVGNQVHVGLFNSGRTPYTGGVATYLLVGYYDPFGGIPSMEQLGKQVLFDFQEAKLPAGFGAALSAHVPPPCRDHPGLALGHPRAFQMDAYRGPVIFDFKNFTREQVNYLTLIGYLVNRTHVCEQSLGRITGGGFTGRGAERVQYEVRIDAHSGTGGPDHLQVKFGGNIFRLSSVTTVAALPSADGLPIVFGTGEGLLNGEPATVFFRFIDAGEPGRLDSVRISIKNSSLETVLDFTGTLDGGNLQWHGAH